MKFRRIRFAAIRPAEGFKRQTQEPIYFFSAVK